MRLWHVDMIDVLPRKQLIGQWRECCLIANQIQKYSSPNHILVNRIMDYPISEFHRYAMEVREEMIHRGYKCDISKFGQYCEPGWLSRCNEKDINKIFIRWHDCRYLRECLYNLEEKAICGAVPLDEWNKIYERYKYVYTLWDGVNK